MRQETSAAGPSQHEHHRVCRCDGTVVAAEHPRSRVIAIHLAGRAGGSRSRTGAILTKLLGRRAAHELIEHMLDGADAGQSAALVVRGEAGIGKSAVLDRARDTSGVRGHRVESCCGVESEAQFAFAGLHQLCAPLLSLAGVLPAPQRAALDVAFGLRIGVVPDRFLVALAVLNLFAEAAEDRPLLCVIDDAHWLDPASAEVLAFVARRVAAERIVLLFAMRDLEAGYGHRLDGLPELRLNGLGDADARTLLGARAPMDEKVLDRIVAESRGNPLALLELSHNDASTQSAGGFELPDALTVPRRIEEAYHRRSASLPEQTQLLLLVASAEPTGDGALLWRAAATLGIARAAVEPAEAAGLLEIDTRVRFRHPLVRSAVYQGATPGNHRRVHGALATATDARLNPDRHAWHRAQAVLGTDENAAEDLERSATRARDRGGVAAAAAFLQQAVELTPEPARRANRALDAAHAKHEAGASETALKLLTLASEGPLDDVQHARIKLLRAQIALHLTYGSDVPGMLLAAAERLAPLDSATSRETYLSALDASIIAGGFLPGRGVSEVARAALNAPAAPTPARPADLLLDGLVATYTRGYVAGLPALRQALEAFRSDTEHSTGTDSRDSRRWLWLASRTAAGLFNDEIGSVLANRHVRLAREAGALSTLPAALVALSVLKVLHGEFARASELAAESLELTRVTGAAPLRYAHLFLASWRGLETETTGLVATSIDGAISPGDSTGASMAYYASAVLHNGLGNYPLAADAAARAWESDELANNSLTLPEFVEAACRAGSPERAAAALDELVSRAHASGTPWALGLAERSLALTSNGSAAEGHYRRALEHLRSSPMKSYLARTHLVYGEWLRREGRRQDARRQLRTAHELLSNMGAMAFASRAALELRATGERAHKPITRRIDALTDHELHIARLVAKGATSREVGSQLFLSPRTIDAHLRNIFRKLDITSRRQLREWLS